MTIPNLDSHPIFGILNNFSQLWPHPEICLNEQKSGDTGLSLGGWLY